MAAEKTSAIILRVTEFSETSCVVTMMTRDFGKITALAKGARRRKSPFEGAIDLLALVRIVFLHKSPQAMDLLTEAKLERRFRMAAVDLERLYFAYYAVDLLNLFTDNNDSEPALYDLAEETLIHLDDGELDPRLVLNRFEMKLLMLAGHQPQLDRCTGCNRAVEAAPRLLFGLLSGGLLCAACRPGNRSVVSVTRATIEHLRRMAADAVVGGDVLSPQVAGESRQLLNQFISHLLGFRPRIQSFLPKGTGR